jgi:hypothetical protein
VFTVFKMRALNQRNTQELVMIYGFPHMLSSVPRKILSEIIHKCCKSFVILRTCIGVYRKLKKLQLN